MLFVARLHWTVCENTLREYFSQFGKVKNSYVVFDKNTGLSKGYGFVELDSVTCVQTALDHKPHVINRQQVQVRPHTDTTKSRRDTTPMQSQDHIPISTD